MRIKFLLLILIALLNTSALLAQWGESAKQIFESPKLKSEVAKHKIVAILPFSVSLTYRKQPKNFSAEANNEQEIKMATSIQASMYTFMLRRAKDYSVSFQDVEKTNILLRKAGMLENMDQFTKDEIAKVLGVDAVLGGRFEQEQTKSDGVALASAVLLGGFGSKTGSASTFLTLNNSPDGELLWRFFKTMDDGIDTSTDDLVERMMRKVSRNFPYGR